MADTEINLSPTVRHRLAVACGLSALAAALAAAGIVSNDPLNFEAPVRGILAVVSLLFLAGLEGIWRPFPALRRAVGWPVLAVAISLMLVASLAPALLVYKAILPSGSLPTLLAPTTLLLPYDLPTTVVPVVENARWAVLLALWWSVVAGWLLVPRPAPPHQSDRFPALLLIAPPLVLTGLMSIGWLVAVLQHEPTDTQRWILPALGSAALLPPLFGLKRGYKELSHLAVPTTTVAVVIVALALLELPAGWPLGTQSVGWIIGCLAFAGYLLFAGNRLALAERVLGPVSLTISPNTPPGQALEVQLAFAPEQPIRLEKLEICLYCHATTTTRSIDRKNDRSYTEQLYRLPAELLLDQEVAANQPRKLLLAVTVPPDAPQTQRSETYRVVWTLDLALRIAEQVDWVGQQEVTIQA